MLYQLVYGAVIHFPKTATYEKKDLLWLLVSRGSNWGCLAPCTTIVAEIACDRGAFSSHARQEAKRERDRHKKGPETRCPQGPAPSGLPSGRSYLLKCSEPPR